MLSSRRCSQVASAVCSNFDLDGACKVQMYRKRIYGSQKFNERLARARATRLQNRLKLPEIDYPRELPELRRRIVVEDFDGQEIVQHEIELYRTNRIDTYRVVIDGLELADRMGWARVLELTRKAFVRISGFVNE